MVVGTEERYLEWLEREEEVLGLDAIIRASTDIEKARRLLFDELGYTPTDMQLDAFMGAGYVKFEALPEIGVRFAREEHAWGYEPVYKDLITGQYTSRKAVEQAMATLEL